MAETKKRIVIREALVWEQARGRWEVEVYAGEQIVGVTRHNEPDGPYLSVLLARDVGRGEATLANRAALERIAAIEPFSGTPRLDVTDWARALDEAQRVARDALEDDDGG